MKVLVTGARGLLGSNVVRELLSRGYIVSVLLRSKEDPTPTLDGLQIENRYYGDICSRESIDRAFRDNDYVINCAAVIGLNPARGKHYWDVNLFGTLNVVNACIDHKIKRLIHVGTANSFGAGTKKVPGTEESIYNAASNGFDYMDAKKEAQDRILSAVKEHNLPAVIVNPTMMFGSYDSRPSSGGVIMALYQGKIPACSPGGRNYIGARDAAMATVNALTMGEVGECYILAGHNLSYREAFDRISKVIGVKSPKFTVPPAGVKIFGSISTILGRFFQFQPAITKEIAYVSCRDDYYSGEKAKRVLNLPITSFEDMVAECYDWFRENQMLNK